MVDVFLTGDEADDDLIPPTSLALIAHYDGSMELRVPTVLQPDTTLPDIWMLIAHVFAVKLQDHAWCDAMVAEIEANTSDERLH